MKYKFSHKSRNSTGFGLFTSPCTNTVHTGWKSKRKTIIFFLKKPFTKEIIEEFKYLLHKESWQEVFLNSETNTKFNMFMDTIVYYFNKAFLLQIKLSEWTRQK